MKSLIAHLLTLAIVIGTQSASACCLFPFSPVYSAGYAPWGWGSAYPPATYGYGGGYGAVNYSAGYFGYSGGGYLDTSGSCCSTSCNSGCCNSGCGVACGSGCQTNCVGTETRKVPEPEKDYDSNSRPRTFGDEAKPTDGFGRGGTGGGADSNVDPTLPDRSNSSGGWRNGDPTQPRNRTAPGNDGTALPELGNEGSGSPFGSGGLDRSTPPPFGTETDSGAGSFGSGGRFNDRGTGNFGNDLDATTPGGSRFRPPADEPTTPEGEHSAKKPEVTTPIEGLDTPDAGTPPADSSVPGKEIEAKDFLPPDIDSSRSSHIDVLTMKRLAGSLHSRNRAGSQLSSSENDERPVRWISVPMPADRARL